MPTLKTARLTLTAPLIHENMDVGYYLRWLSNERVVKYSEQRHLTHTNETQYDYIISFVDSHDYFWEIQRNSKPIGSISAYRDLPNRIANVGVMIGDTNLWGQGYASEAWDGVCSFLFEEGCRKIEAGCMACNEPMIRLLEKQGFSREASVSGHFLLNGNPEDKVLYGKYSQAKIIPLKKIPTNDNA
jgi:RimJ/RimL family protein N-acetyltransferase